MTHRAYEIEKNPQTEPCPNTLLLNGKKGRLLATGSVYDSFSNFKIAPCRYHHIIIENCSNLKTIKFNDKK